MSRATIATVDQKLSDLIDAVKDIRLDNKAMDIRITDTNTRVTRLETQSSYIGKTNSIMREWKMWLPNFVVALLALGIALYK